MKRYCCTLAILTALMLSACSGINGEPGESTGDAQVTETTAEPIRIESETEKESSAETTESGENLSTLPSDGAGSETAESKAAAETEAAAVYEVTALQKTMYATQPVHVRAGYTMKSEVLTSIGTNHKVEVTGRSANGWMRIVYNGKDAYVYQKYLSESRTVSQNDGGSSAEAGASQAGENPTASIPGGSPAGGNDGPTTGAGGSTTGVGSPTAGVGGPTAGVGGPTVGVGGSTADNSGSATGVSGPAAGVSGPTTGAGSSTTGSQPTTGPASNQNTEQIQTIPAAPIGGTVETLVPGEVSGPGVSPAGAVSGAAPGM